MRHRKPLHWLSGGRSWIGELFVVLTAACAPGTIAPTPTPSAAPAPPPPPPPVVAPPVTRPGEGRVAIGAAGDLVYRVAGSSRDTVIVPLGAYLSDALTPLSSTHTLIFYDPRHRGRSDPYPDSTLSTFDNDVQDLEAVRDHFGVSRTALVGFSYFGAVVIAYAAKHPDRVTRIVLLSPIEPTDSLEHGYDPPERRARIDTTKARALLKLRAAGRDTTDRSGYCTAYWRLNAPLFVGELGHAGRITPTWCQWPNESPRALGEHVTRVISSLGPTRDFARLAPRVSPPTLIVYGDQDLITNPAGARAWARLLPQARTWSVPGAGHLVFLEDRDGVVRVLDRFLRGEWP
jgi:proline iminopeptidase